MAKLTTLKVDLALQDEGVRVNYGGIDLTVARANRPAYMEAARKHKKMVRDGEISQAEAEELMKELAAEFLLLGWKGMEDDDGKPIPYSKEKALEIFKDPQLNDFYLFVIMTANNRENYRVRELKADAGK